MNKETNEMNEGRGPSCSVIRLAVLRPNDALSRIGTERALLAICCRRTVRNSSNPPWRKRETAEEQPSSAASFVRQGGAGPLGRVQQTPPGKSLALPRAAAGVGRVLRMLARARGRPALVTEARCRVRAEGYRGGRAARPDALARGLTRLSCVPASSSRPSP